MQSRFFAKITAVTQIAAAPSIAISAYTGICLPKISIKGNINHPKNKRCRLEHRQHLQLNLQINTLKKQRQERPRKAHKQQKLCRRALCL